MNSVSVICIGGSVILSGIPSLSELNFFENNFCPHVVIIAFVCGKNSGIIILSLSFPKKSTRSILLQL